MVRTPVDDPVGAVDPALLVQVHEEAHHRAHVLVVHREPLAPVVHGGAHPAELVHDRAAVLTKPVPDELDERVAPVIVSRLALFRQMLLDGGLGRDTGVVVSRQERRLEAAHPMPAHEGVRERDLERVARVQRAGHVRRRVRDNERLAAASGLRVVEAFLLPGALPALLDPLRLVERLHARIVRLRTLRVRRQITDAVRQRLWAQYRCCSVIRQMR